MKWGCATGLAKSSLATERPNQGTMELSTKKRKVRKNKREKEQEKE
jgi:hypothetical protein